ncbi:MAG: hypothetical protein CMJ78_14795 [Planctomycetaceae bacterium]|nr:hypothetical protein [Planctomycetaceae bacterium]
MLSILGDKFTQCDGVTRRSFLTAGATGFLGLSLADLLQAEAISGVGSSNKAIINVHLDGGPPHMDMVDLKPDAPSEIRGEFSPISSRIPGFQVGELMPRIASIANRFAFIRSLIQSAGRHDGFQCQSGFNVKDLQAIGGRPAMGCVLNKLLGSPDDTAPAFVDMMQGRPLVRNSSRPGFLGPSFKPFRPDMSALFQRELETGMKGELARLGQDHTVSMRLNPALEAGRLSNRTQLLSQLDSLRGEIDATGMMSAMDRFTQQAVGILTSGRFADAMDMSKEPESGRKHYYLDPASVPGRHVTSDLPNAVTKFLLARRLVEAGVRCVSVSISDFDTHSANFPRMKQMLPIVDFGLHALITDLEQRGMLDDVSVVVWGEFGRTPRIDAKTGGRHHWPRVGMAMLAGGGMQVDQVIGSTDRTASSAINRPITYKDVFATLYHNLGIDASRTTLIDTTGRPQYLLDEGSLIRELV